MGFSCPLPTHPPFPLNAVFVVVMPIANPPRGGPVSLHVSRPLINSVYAMPSFLLETPVAVVDFLSRPGLLRVVGQHRAGQVPGCRVSITPPLSPVVTACRRHHACGSGSGMPCEHHPRRRAQGNARPLTTAKTAPQPARHPYPRGPRPRNPTWASRSSAPPPPP